MKIKYISNHELKRQIRTIANQHLDLDRYKLFFFGSRVRGDNFETADIDIGVQGIEPLSVTKKLALIEDLEKLPILYKIDVVDFARVSEKFKRQALMNIELI